MIIYGWKSVHLKTEKDKMIKCPSCDTQGSLDFHYFSDHAHIFWIPLFPYKRKGVIACDTCDYESKPKNLPEHVKRSYANIKRDTKIPFWQFAGVALIAGLITFGYFQSKSDTKEELEYIASPRQGDIYSYKTEGGYYSTLKVAEITGDSLFVVPNEFETNKRTGISDIDKDSNYGEYMYSISRDEIQSMYDEEEIYDISRE